MEYDKNICPVVNVDGVIERGKQYDLDITLPEDNRNVIYGIVRDCYKDPICDAVVKLIEVECKLGKDIRTTVNKYGTAAFSGQNNSNNARYDDGSNRSPKDDNNKGSGGYFAP